MYRFMTKIVVRQKHVVVRTNFDEATFVVDVIGRGKIGRYISLMANLGTEVTSNDCNVR